jgi:hypothetical protein
MSSSDAMRTSMVCLPSRRRRSLVGATMRTCGLSSGTMETPIQRAGPAAPRFRRGVSDTKPSAATVRSIRKSPADDGPMRCVPSRDCTSSESADERTLNLTTLRTSASMRVGLRTSVACRATYRGGVTTSATSSMDATVGGTTALRARCARRAGSVSRAATTMNAPSDIASPIKLLPTGRIRERSRRRMSAAASLVTRAYAYGAVLGVAYVVDPATGETSSAAVMSTLRQEGSRASIAYAERIRRA